MVCLVLMLVEVYITLRYKQQTDSKFGGFFSSNGVENIGYVVIGLYCSQNYGVIK